MSKYDPFIKQCLGAKYKEKSFDELTISTATIDVRLPEIADVNYKYLFEHLSVDDRNSTTVRGPAGTIFGAKEGDKSRGNPPTKTSKALKNATMIWIWLLEKWVNVKISRSSLHITGCKKLEQAAEACRYVQQHMELLVTYDFKPYGSYPYALRFDVNMINYNFSLDVALSLPDFEEFLYKRRHEQIVSSYDQNIHGTCLPLRCPELRVKYTVNDNGQVSMCTSVPDIEQALYNVRQAYSLFFDSLEEFQNE
uniref:Uncharacterized protein n=1 Tax=viral metagenome TaxID=1070528 RepID=A0A6C0CI00_9ZZZZ